MNKHTPLILIVAGFLIFIGGFIYDIFFAGIPYQDPTPAMTANYEYHAMIASLIRDAGLAAMLFGIILAVVRRRAKQPRA